MTEMENTPVESPEAQEPAEASTEMVDDGVETADPDFPVEEATEIPQFDELGAESVQANPAALSMVYDLTLPVAIELGRTRMSVQEVLALGRGSVVQLERLAGEPIDVFVGDRRFAEGEVVVVGEQFGVRITRVLIPPTSTSGEES